MKSRDAHLGAIDAACSLMHQPSGGARLRELGELGERGFSVRVGRYAFVNYEFYVDGYNQMMYGHVKQLKKTSWLYIIKA